MSDEQVERVAKEIYEIVAADSPHPECEPLWEDIPNFQQKYKRAARAAIAAMQPTPQEAAKVLLDACPNPLFDTLKPKLMGEFSQQYPVIDEDGEEFMARVNISWTVIKEVIHTTLRAIAGEARHD